LTLSPARGVSDRGAEGTEAPPSAERTTSVMEREMREATRRTDVGARWSLSGITTLSKLRLAKRHGQDDHERVPTPLQTSAKLTMFPC